MLRHIAAILILLLAGALVPAQNQPVQPQPESSEAEADPQFRRNRNDRVQLDPEWERKRMKALNEERHQSLKKDTDELLKLATELKEHVDKTNENMMSVDVIDKAEEIEKLAKRVRNKMKGIY